MAAPYSARLTAMLDDDDDRHINGLYAAMTIERRDDEEDDDVEEWQDVRTRSFDCCVQIGRDCDA